MRVTANIIPLSAGADSTENATQSVGAAGPLTADARALSHLLGVGVRSIRTWDYSGKLPRPVKIGGRTVWIIDEIKAWLAAGAPPRDEWEARRRAEGGRR